MTANAWIQLGLFLAVLLAAFKPLGWYMARVYQGQSCGLDRALGWLERGIYRRHSTWPSRHSGRIRRSGGETWRAVDDALRMGYRGLPGGSSLSQRLDKHRAIAEAAINLLG